MIEMTFAFLAGAAAMYFARPHIDAIVLKYENARRANK